MKAATAAGITPVGVLAPESNSDIQRDLLMQHGAKKVLTNINGIMEMLG